MEVITPTNARKNLYGLIKHVVMDNQPVEIANTKDNESVVIVSKSDWNALQETLFLQNAGVLDRIQQYEKEESEDLGCDRLGYHVKIKKNARKDLPKLKSIHLNDKFDELILLLRENPFQSPPPYEKLTGLPYYSRCLNIQHHLVYSVDVEEKIITILSV